MAATSALTDSAFSWKQGCPLFFCFLGRYRSEAAGIILSVAAAMGFAALETMGYGFVTLLQSRGNLAVLDEVLLVRGLFSPAGHAAWTGLICAALWRERLRAGSRVINGKVISAFVSAFVLHALWDTFNSLRGATSVSWASLEVLSLLVAFITLTLIPATHREELAYQRSAALIARTSGSRPVQILCAATP